MVGVPQSKGCEACRKQKKSCEGDAIPCVRCKRLKIPCIGRGQQRFKFQDETVRFENKAALGRPAKKPKINGVKITFDGSQTPPERKQSMTVAKQSRQASITRMPSTPMNYLMASFACNIDPTMDSRFQPPWNFGKLLQIIPTRLGRNPALDASAEAVLAAYSSYRARRPDGSGDVDGVIQQNCLGYYNKAIKALCASLNNAAEAGSSETLCSTMLLLMVETLSSPINEQVLRHAGGAAHILKARGYNTAKNDFELKVLLSLRGPVVFQALFSPQVLFTDEQWHALMSNPFAEEGPIGKLLTNLSRIPNLLHRVRKALSRSSLDYIELQGIRMDLWALRGAHALTLKECIDNFDRLEKTHPGAATKSKAYMMEHCQIGRHTGMGYALEIHLLMLLSAVDYPATPAPEPPKFGTSNYVLDEWMQQAAARALDISELAERVADHRPLGTFYMDFLLKLAYICAENRATQLRILGQIWEFAYNMLGSKAQVDLDQLELIRGWLTINDLREKWQHATDEDFAKVLNIIELPTDGANLYNTSSR